LGRLHQTG